MPVSLISWRLLVGHFNRTKFPRQRCFKPHTTSGKNYCSLFIFVLLLLLLDGDIHPNPGPNNDKDYNFSVAYWNVNSIPVHNFSKISLFSSYNSIYKYDLIFLSETFLDSSYFNIPFGNFFSYSLDDAK